MVRPTAQNCFESLMLDIWPRAAAIVDFGLDSDEHYAALKYCVKHDGVTAEQLDQVLGNGKKLTKMVKNSKTNPYKDVVFETDYDFMYEDEDEE